MNRLIVLSLLAFAVSRLGAQPRLAASAQVEFSLSTDKLRYHYGEEVYVTVTAVNHGLSPVTLTFMTCEEASYTIDTCRWDRGLAFCQAITYRTIPPLDSAVWGNGYFGPFPGPFTGCPFLEPGRHALLAQVGSYWTSDTLWIEVSPVTGLDQPRSLPPAFGLDDAFPNPFNPTTTIQYRLPRSTDVTVKVFTLLGVEVATLVRGEVAEGVHTARWDGSAFPGGVYFCRLQAGPFVATRTLLLLR